MNENNAAQAAIKAVPPTIWWHPDGYTVNNNFSGEDLILRSAALDALSKLRAEGVQAGEPVYGEARNIWLVCISREYYDGGDLPLLAVSTEAMAAQIVADLSRYCDDLRERLNAYDWQHEADPEKSNKLYEESAAIFAAAQFPHGIKLDRYNLDHGFSTRPLELAGATIPLASAPVAGELTSFR